MKITTKKRVHTQHEFRQQYKLPFETDKLDVYQDPRIQKRVQRDIDDATAAIRVLLKDKGETVSPVGYQLWAIPEGVELVVSAGVWSNG